MNILRKIKYFIQRGRRGYSDEDTWDFDSYLCKIIPPAIRELKKGTGCPHEFYDKEKKNDECWKWKEVLEEIAQGFEAHDEINHMRYFQMKKEGEYFTQEIDKERLKNLTAKQKRGMELFCKYFGNLWD